MDYSLFNVSEEFSAFNEEILSKMYKDAHGVWQCNICDWSSQRKSNLYNHVEAKHVNTKGYFCNQCHKFCSTLNALKLHESRYHRKLKM